MVLRRGTEIGDGMTDASVLLRRLARDPFGVEMLPDLEREGDP